MINQNWVEDEHVGEYPVEGEGHIKSWKHKDLEVEVAVAQQHKGMLMYNQVYIAEMEDGEKKVRQISNDMESSSAAIEEAKFWMRNNPMAGRKGRIYCKDCGEKVGLESSKEELIICNDCDHYEMVEGESEHFEVVKEDGREAVVRGRA